jgi:hypothetical protein
LRWFCSGWRHFAWCITVSACHQRWALATRLWGGSPGLVVCFVRFVLLVLSSRTSKQIVHRAPFYRACLFLGVEAAAHAASLKWPWALVRFSGRGHASMAFRRLGPSKQACIAGCLGVGFGGTLFAAGLDTTHSMDPVHLVGALLRASGGVGLAVAISAAPLWFCEWSCGPLVIWSSWCVVLHGGRFTAVTG